MAATEKNEPLLDYKLSNSFVVSDKRSAGKVLVKSDLRVCCAGIIKEKS